MLVKKVKTLVVLCAANSIATATIGLTMYAQPSQAQAPSFCQCVGYVQRAIGAHIPVMSAKDAIGALPRMRYRQVGAQNGAIAVFQPSHGSVDRTHGHIGIVVGSGNGSVTIRSTNQQSNRQFPQLGCSNVSDVNFRINNSVSFWAR